MDISIETNAYLILRFKDLEKVGPQVDRNIICEARELRHRQIGPDERIPYSFANLSLIFKATHAALVFSRILNRRVLVDSPDPSFGS